MKDGVIHHDEFKIIIEEKKNYDCLKNEERTEKI